MVELFTLTGSEMTDRGDFFATMFVAISSACLFSYYLMGWGTNILAQVSIFLHMRYDIEFAVDTFRRLQHTICENKSSTICFVKMLHRPP